MPKLFTLHPSCCCLLRLGHRSFHCFSQVGRARFATLEIVFPSSSLRVSCELPKNDIRSFVTLGTPMHSRHYADHITETNLPAELLQMPAAQPARCRHDATRGCLKVLHYRVHHTISCRPAAEPLRCLRSDLVLACTEPADHASGSQASFPASLGHCAYRRRAC